MTQYVVSIDWSLGKEAVSGALAHALKPLWDKHLPRGRKAGREVPKVFWKGLKILRDRWRGRQWKDAVSGVYEHDLTESTPRADTSSPRGAAARAMKRLVEFSERLKKEQSALCTQGAWLTDQFPPDGDVAV